MTGPKVSQLSFDLLSSLFFHKRERHFLWDLNSSLGTNSGTCLRWTMVLHLWYSWTFVIFFLYPPHPYTWPYSKALCSRGLNVLRGKSRHCCSGWSSLVIQTPVKEVVLHLPEGHLRHISYIIIHTVRTSSRAAGETRTDGALRLYCSWWDLHMQTEPLHSVFVT